MRWTTVATPIGDLGVAAEDGLVCAVRFDGPPASPSAPAAADDEVLRAASAQLAAYFAGERTAFDLPLASPRGSEFERTVWAALAEIPYAEMRTYGEIAAAAGDRTAARAVGVACNRNRLPIVVPCHRVVGA